MKINTLKLQEFRCFDDYQLEFSDRFTLLIGDNGSGKTAILDALASSISGFLKGFKKALKPSDLRPISKDDIRYITLEMGQTTIRETGKYPLLISAKGILNEVLFDWDILDLPAYDSDREIAAISSELAEKIIQNGTLLPVLIYYGTGRLWKKIDQEVEILSPNSRLLGYRNCLTPTSDLERLFSWFKTQELAALQKQERRHILEAVREAIISMIPDAKKVWWDIDWDELLIQTSIQGQTRTLPFYLLSDGYRNLIGMAADIAYRMATLNPQLETDVIKKTEGIVLIDEIDLHLHPKWQRQVVGRLLDTFPKVQFVASSHSPFIIQSLYHRDDVLLWDLEKAQAVDITSKSIEDIAEDQQGVEIPQQTQRFLDMEKAAEAYYSALKQIPTASEDKKQHLRQRLDELLIRYSDDPAFQAFLKMERLAVEGNGGA